MCLRGSHDRKISSINPSHISFHFLTNQQAEDVVYNQLLPGCQRQGVVLTSEGNLSNPGETLNPSRVPGFNMERIQKTYEFLGQLIQPSGQLGVHSSGLKQRVEILGDFYVKHGELIAAMLLNGYEAHFGAERKDFYCHFNATFL